MRTLVIFLFVIFYEANCQAGVCTEQNLTRPAQCSLNIKIKWWDIKPYSTIFKEIIQDSFLECCGPCVNFTYDPRPANDSEQLREQIGNNSDIAFPVYGEMTKTVFQEEPYFPVVESPGVIYLQKVQEAGNSAGAVINAVLQGWPILVLTLIMASLSGIVMWALDSYWNPEEFPSSFFKGSWEGFWWAFVSMTTVGYGDRAPRSFIARVFAFFWVLIGLVIISIFTATVTTSLTALSLSNDITLYGRNVVALKNTEEQRYGVRKNANVSFVESLQGFVDKIMMKTENADDSIAGGLIDSYVAGHNMEFLQKYSVYVAHVFDHQFAYGFVISNKLKTGDMEKCLRKYLSTEEAKITGIIQKKMKAFPKPDKSAAEEKSSSLFDAKSPVFKQAVYACLGLIFILTLCGIIWEYCYWRPKQKKEQPPPKEDPRVDTPHSTFEELVAAQCQELEDAMITEVMAFYKAFNGKLDEIRQRNLRNEDLDQVKKPTHFEEDEPTIAI